MKKLHFLFLFILLLFTGCKKDSVDATSTKNFRSSINDMAGSLNTLQQTKFNEALYILKTFGVTADGDAAEMKSLRELLNGKKVPEIFAMADDVAKKNNVEWSSTAPPSLGEMNIFEDLAAKESDGNDIAASGLNVNVKPISIDSLSGPKALQIIPRLVDKDGKNIDFKGAALETNMVITSNGSQILSSKNLMVDNNFNGFNVKLASLSAEKLSNNTIDITVSVKTTKKVYKMTKVGIALNPRTLKQPQVITEQIPSETSPEMIPGNNPEDLPTNTEPGLPPKDLPKAKTLGEPKAAVQNFLSNLSSQNLKNAYDVSANPAWGSYDNFANANSGFGNVKKLNVKNISTNSSSATAASVNATYDVLDKSGKNTSLLVTFGLKNVNGEWKISSYKINK